MIRQLRMLAVLGVLLLLNAVFVAALLWGYLVLLVGIVAGGLIAAQTGTFAFTFLQFPVSLPVYLVIFALFLFAQLSYGYNRLLSSSTDTTDEGDHEIQQRVRRLAIQMDVPEPAVKVLQTDTLSCYTVGRFTNATIVVTTGLVESLDTDELDGVLAHELAHIANRDVTLMTITTVFLEVADRAYHESQLGWRALTAPDELPQHKRRALRWFGPFIILTSIIVAPLLSVFPWIANWATRELSQARELAADEAAARATGNPLALATALLTLSAESPTPTTDLRTTRTQALCVVPTDIVKGEPTSSIPDPNGPTDAADRREYIHSWLSGTTKRQTRPTSTLTHPPVQDRVAHLRDLAAELEHRR